MLRTLRLAMVACLAFCTAASAAQYFVDAETGDDAAPGTSAEKAWKTIARVNKAQLNPGDSVQFRRGQTWREALRIDRPGADGKPITYGAFGKGDRPRILGSLDRGGEANWKPDGEDLWYTEKVRWEPNYFKLRQGMIFHDGVGGQQRAAKGQLSADWDWWIDADNNRAYVRLAHNPGRSRIEVQQRYGISFSGADYITVRDLEIAYAEIGIGIWQADHWIIENCYIHDVVVDGIHANGTAENSPDDGVIRNCEFQDWNWKGHKLTQHNYQEWSKSEPFMGYGIHIFRGDNWRIVGNKLRFKNNYSGMDCSPIAFDDAGHATLIADNDVDGAKKMFGPTAGLMYWATEGDKPTVIRGNTFRDIGGMGIIIQEFNRYKFSQPVTIEGNVLVNTCWGDGLDQEVIRVWTKYDGAGLITVRNNIIYGAPKGQNTHHGIRVRQSKADVVNNTVIGADRGVSVEGGSSVSAFNNIATGNRQAACAVEGGGKLAESNNCWHGKTAGFTPDASDIDADPKLINPEKGEFGLQSTSPCIDKGKDVGLKYTGSAPDMGAVERKGD